MTRAQNRRSVPIDAVSAMPLAGEGDGQDVKAGDTVKAPEIGCSNAPSGSYGSRRDEPVMRPDVLSGRGEPGPDAGVRTSGEKAEGQRGERVQDRLDEGLTAGPNRGMTVCLIAVILRTSFGTWERLPGSLEIGCGVTVLSGGEGERNWSQRYKANLEKLASGDLIQSR